MPALAQNNLIRSCSSGGNRASLRDTQPCRGAVRSQSKPADTESRKSSCAPSAPVRPSARSELEQAAANLFKQTAKRSVAATRTRSSGRTLTNLVERALNINPSTSYSSSDPICCRMPNRNMPIDCDWKSAANSAITFSKPRRLASIVMMSLYDRNARHVLSSFSVNSASPCNRYVVLDDDATFGACPAARFADDPHIRLHSSSRT